MTRTARRAAAACALALAASLLPVPASAAQEMLHKIEGRLLAGTRSMGHVRVRLVLRSGLRRVAETVTRTDGRFVFPNLAQGDYLVQSEETEDFQAAEALVEVRKKVLGSRESRGGSERPETFAGSTYFVTLYLVPRDRPVAAHAAGVVAADVDTDVPARARERFERAMARRDAGDRKRCVEELRAAVDAHPAYYAARLELGRELRHAKQFSEACEVLEPLVELAPKRADALVEIGMSLLAQDRREQAAEALAKAVAREETNWAAHLYLGYALVDVNDEQAEPHFWRALKLNEREAAAAHLALARLAHRYNFLKEAVEQLEAYLAVAPEAPDAGQVRKLAEKLKKEMAGRQP